MVEWKTSDGLTAYAHALEGMQQRVDAMLSSDADELVWLLEHPPLYTGGTSAKTADLLDARFEVFDSGRGGEYTYHGPGQRIAYTMLDLNTRGRDLRAYVQQLEQWIILTLAEFDVEGFTREGRIGVWVDESSPTVGRSQSERTNGSTACAGSWQPLTSNDKGTQQRDPAMSSPHREGQQTAAGGKHKSEKKIAALGIRVRKWMTFHGIALNVNPDLSHYNGIVPCGIFDYGVTSLAALGVDASMKDVDAALKKSFAKVF
jgi:lipoyl(octanoyl) transferase